MFYVPKQEIIRHWSAFAGTVKEDTGAGHPDNNDFSCFEEAYDYALEEKRKQLNKTYEDLKRRYSSAELFVYRIRSLWNKRIRNGLQRYEEKLQKAKEATEAFIDVVITELPTMIPVLGNRIALGTHVYTIYTDTLTLYEDVVISESIHYYSFHPEGSAATYELAKRGYVSSTLESGYSNVEVYLNKERAKARLLVLITQKRAELEEQLKSL